MQNSIFLDVHQIIAIHDRYLLEFGGLAGIRDMGLLESAALSTQASFDNKYLCEDIFFMTSTYAHD